MFGSKISIALAATALLVSVLFATPLGQAAGSLVLAKNSVGTAQLKRDAVTGPKVKNGSLLAADFKAGQLPAGPQGPKGDTGDPGASGAPGAQGAPGTARAFALVDPGDMGNPSFVGTHVKNFTAITHPGTGKYCLTPSAGIDPATTAPAITVEDGLSSGHNHVAFWQAAPSACSAGSFEVKTYEFSPNAALSDNVAFTIVVP